MKTLCACLSILLLSISHASSEETLILDETAYLRSYYTFGWDRVSPKVLKADGEKILGRGLKRAEKAVLKKMRKRDPKADAAGWMNHVYCRVTGHNTYADTIESPNPPEDWVSPGFDDSDWLHQRRPYLSGYGGGMRVRLACYRSWFDVAEPRNASLKLNLAYRGGVRVLLNGKEIARGHLPDGVVTVETPATTYPPEAYLRTNEELTPAEKKQWARYIDRPADKQRYFYRYVGGLPGPWDEQPAYRSAKDGQPELKRGGGIRGGLPREVWMRILKQRDRQAEAIELPKSLLKKGSNLLAIEVHRSDIHPLVFTDGWNRPWPHASLISLKLIAPEKASAVSGLKRPKGMQVWVRDLHARTYATDFLEPGAPAGKLRWIGARNGTYAGQVSVGSSTSLQNVKVTSTALTSEENGHQIKTDHIRIFPMVPRPAHGMAWGGTGRNGEMRNSIESKIAALRACRKKPADPKQKLPPVDYYGHICWAQNTQTGDGLNIPEDYSRSFWVSVKVPSEATPGVYQGTLHINADSQTPVNIPIRLEATAWRLPDAKSFRTVVAAEQSPYGVAKHYKAELWSDEHFKLMESSFHHLGRLGNDWLNIPVLIKTEFGNREDMMMPWIRKTDGSLSFDYSRLDRYLDLAMRYWGKPRVINFVVMHGAEGNTSQVFIVDEKTKKKELVTLSGKAATPQLRRDLWGTFARSLFAHMKARGLDKSMYWGYAWDKEADPSLKSLMKGFAPSVRWTRGSHHILPDEYHGAVSCIYAGRSRNFGNRGWKGKDINLINPRQFSDTINIRGDYPPFIIRALPDRALSTGRQGIGRIGADYGKAYYSGFRQITPCGEPGFPIRNLYYFGAKGAETSARAEVLLEGVQETELRIFLERAMDYSLVGDVLKAEIKDTLARHMQETHFYPKSFADYNLAALSQGWRTRSEKLYRLAGKAAQVVGLDMDRYEIETDVAARGIKVISVKLTNHARGPQSWKVSEHPEWVQPARKAGKVSILDDLSFTLNATSLKPESIIEGDIVIQKDTGDTKRQLRIKVNVGELVKLPMETYKKEALSRICYGLKPGEDLATFNAPPGGKETRAYSLLNASGTEFNWRASASDPWISISPETGTLQPGKSVELNITAAPTEPNMAVLKSQLHITEVKGSPILKRKLMVYVLPEYNEPSLLGGKGVPLMKVTNKKTLNFYKNSLPWGVYLKHGYKKDTPTFVDKGQTMAVGIPNVTEFKLDGLRIHAFSSRVCPGIIARNEREGLALANARCVFEIHADDEILATSGIMTVKDAPRLLSVKGLQDAKVLKLVTRHDYPEPQNAVHLVGGYWREALVYQKGKASK